MMKKRISGAGLGLILGIAGITASAQEAKDLGQPPSAGVAPATTEGASDAFGYTVSSCNASFFDISATGTNILSGDDVASAAQALTGNFNLYGVDLTQLFMMSNGFLATTGDGAGDLSNDCPLPSVPSTGTGARIYPLHDDLITGSGYFEYFATCPVTSPDFPAQNLGCHIFQWSDVTHFGDATVWEFQAVLFDDSYEIIFIHGAGNPETGSGSTTGLQNAAASIGLTFACNNAGSIPDLSAQCISHPGPNLTDLQVSISDTPDPVVAGETLTYTITVNNGSAGDATNASLAITLPAGVSNPVTTGCTEDPAGTPTCSLGTVTAGGNAVVTLTVDVNLATVGTISLQADASADQVDTNPADNSASEDTLVIEPTADLSITKVDNADPVVAGDPLSYTVTVNNAGPQAAQNVIVNDVLPTGVTFVSTTGCANDPSGVPNCNLGTIAAAGSAQYTINVTVNAATAGTITNNATVSSTTTDPNGANNSTSEDTLVTPPQADLVLTISDTAMPPVAPFSQYDYILDLTNNGPQDATMVQTVVDLPDSLSFVSSVGGCANASGQVVTWNLATLANAAAAQCVFTVAVNFGDQIVVTGTTTSAVEDPLPDNNTDVAAAPVGIAALVVPTLSSWSLLLLTLVLLLIGGYSLKRRLI
ncbi:MAG: hypothetical protein Tsb002_09400 [Wenzhouxiangellaceae bacterium]